MFKKESYLFAKYLAAFATGGFVVLIPMWINVMLNAMVNPAGMMNVNTWLTILQPYFLSELYYTHPVIYVVCVLFMDFIWGGICAGIALMFSICLNNIIYVFLSPMILLQIVNLLEGFMQNKNGVLVYELSPLKLFRAMTYAPNPALLVMLIQFILLSISFVGFIFGGKKCENM